jgi:hypothetical protein
MIVQAGVRKFLYVKNEAKKGTKKNGEALFFFCLSFNRRRRVFRALLKRNAAAIYIYTPE